MRVIVDIGHPGHVHFYKHVIWRLQKEGHKTLISARDKDVTLDLLDHYALPYRTLSTIGSGHWGMAKEFLQREWALLRLVRDFNPDVVTEIGGVFVAPICKLLGKPSVVFTDSEHVRIDRYLTYPFASEVCTPACFKRDIGKSHIRYPGYHFRSFQLISAAFNPVLTIYGFHQYLLVIEAGSERLKTKFYKSSVEKAGSYSSISGKNSNTCLLGVFL